MIPTQYQENPLSTNTEKSIGIQVLRKTGYVVVSLSSDDYFNIVAYNHLLIGKRLDSLKAGP